MKIKYKYALDDFEVVKTNIPRDQNYYKYKSNDFPTTPGYEVFKFNAISLLFRKKERRCAPEIRREKLLDIAIWLSTETGVDSQVILDDLKKNQ